MRDLFIIKQSNPQHRRIAVRAIERIGELAQVQDIVITIAEPTRSLEQNALLWELLSHVSRKMQWPVDGKLQYLAPDDWKDMFTASLKKSQRVAQGIDGGFVMLGSRTSKMGKKEMTDLIELIYAFCAEREIETGEAMA